MRLRVLADDPRAVGLFQRNLLLGPALDAARIGVVEIACCPGRKAQERCPALGFLAITYHHPMHDQDGHGGWLLPSGPRALLKRLALFWLTYLLIKRDQAIADLARQGHTLGATGSDVDGHRRAGHIIEAGLLHRIVTPPMADPFARPELPNQRHRFFHACRAFLVVSPAATTRNLVDRFASPDPHKDAPRSEQTQRGKRLRDDLRTLAISWACDARAQQEALRALPQGGQRHPGKATVPQIVLPGLKVIVGPDGSESCLLGLHAQFHQLRERKLFV